MIKATDHIDTLDTQISKFIIQYNECDNNLFH